jgi:glucose-6-phosphate 1-epimerase
MRQTKLSRFACQFSILFQQATEVGMPVQPSSFKGRPALTLTHAGAEAVVLFHGAQVMSWKPAGLGEQLYFSDQADCAPGSAIRGGIPLCFPQFGLMGDLPLHGFARNRDWERDEAFSGPDSSGVCLKLADAEATRALWPHAFAATLRLTLAASRLRLDFGVGNTGQEPFTFRCAFQTYERVPDVREARVEGLAGMPLHDKAPGGAGVHTVAEDDRLAISGFTERIYATGGKSLVLRTPQGALQVASDNMPDAVIWNPWEERARQIPDLPDDGYLRMLCLESAVVAEPVTLAPGEDWTGSQILTPV